jgi:hypothetical protein
MKPRTFSLLGAACALALAAQGAQAQATIDQNKALAGGITAGDGAGYPIVISQSGSYKLTSNLLVPAGAKGIVVTASNVSIDLNGFSLVGPSSCTRDGSSRQVACTHSDNVTHGIDSSAATGTVVRNGTVKGFAGYGIYAGGMERLEALRITENYSGVGELSAVGLSISASTIDLNGNLGLLLARGLVTNCRVVKNGGSGVVGTLSMVVADSVIANNRQFGLSDGVARGTLFDGNGTNRSSGVVSLGGNLDGLNPF